MKFLLGIISFPNYNRIFLQHMLNNNLIPSYICIRALIAGLLGIALWKNTWIFNRTQCITWDKLCMLINYLITFFLGRMNKSFFFFFYFCFSKKSYSHPMKNWIEDLPPNDNCLWNNTLCKLHFATVFLKRTKW